MKGLIENFLIEDPNLKFEINEENGEFLLSGVGPLHLEVTATEIGKRGINVSVSEPRAVFKESCNYISSVLTVHSPNQKNSLKLKIERLDNKSVQFFQNIKYRTAKSINKLEEILKERTKLNREEIEHFLICDDEQNVLIYNGKLELDEFYKNTIIEITKKIVIILKSEKIPRDKHSKNKIEADL